MKMNMVSQVECRRCGKTVMGADALSWGKTIGPKKVDIVSVCVGCVVEVTVGHVATPSDSQGGAFLNMGEAMIHEPHKHPPEETGLGG